MNARVMAPPLPAGNGAPWNSPKYSFKTYFSYEVDIATSLAAAGSRTLTFNIAGDSDFFWTKMEAYALVGGVATTVSGEELPACTMLVVNTTSGRQYSSNPTPLPSVSGSGRLPFILPMMTLWESKSTISITLLNIGDDTYSNLLLTFSGVKAFLQGSG